MVHESKMHDSTLFATLTYDEEHGRPSLHHPDWQLFAKRLRKKCGPFRFFMCGEYGEKLDRPHFHAVLYGLNLPDLEPVSSVQSKHQKLKSALLTKTWGQGLTDISVFTPGAAQYVAGYVFKKMSADERERRGNDKVLDWRTGQLVERVPEYARMSLRPGIGFTYFEKYHRDILNWDNVIIDGKEWNIPPYYDTLISRLPASDIDAIKFARSQKGDAADRTRARLETREKVAQARVNHYNSRKL